MKWVILINALFQLSFIISENVSLEPIIKYISLFNQSSNEIISLTNENEIILSLKANATFTISDQNTFEITSRTSNLLRTTYNNNLLACIQLNKKFHLLIKKNNTKLETFEHITQQLPLPTSKCKIIRLENETYLIHYLANFQRKWFIYNNLKNQLLEKSSKSTLKKFFFSDCDYDNILGKIICINNAENSKNAGEIRLYNLDFEESLRFYLSRNLSANQVVSLSLSKVCNFYLLVIIDNENNFNCFYLEIKKKTGTVVYNKDVFNLKNAKADTQGIFQMNEKYSLIYITDIYERSYIYLFNTVLKKVICSLQESIALQNSNFVRITNSFKKNEYIILSFSESKLNRFKFKFLHQSITMNAMEMNKNITLNFSELLGIKEENNKKYFVKFPLINTHSGYALYGKREGNKSSKIINEKDNIWFQDIIFKIITREGVQRLNMIVKEEINNTFIGIIDLTLQIEFLCEENCELCENQNFSGVMVPICLRCIQGYDYNHETNICSKSKSQSTASKFLMPCQKKRWIFSPQIKSFVCIESEDFCPIDYPFWDTSTNECKKEPSLNDELSIIFTENTTVDSVIELIKNNKLGLANINNPIEGPNFRLAMNEKGRIQLNQCQEMLRRIYSIPESEEMKIITLDIFGELESQLKYGIFSSSKGKLDTTVCDKENVTLLSRMTANSHLERIEITSGITFKSIDDPFFTENCFPFTTKKKDIILSERNKYYFFNATQCMPENNCEVIFINTLSGEVLCMCTNVTENSQLVEVYFTKNQIYSDDRFSISMVKVASCWNNFFYQDLSSNPGIYIMSLICAVQLGLCITFWKNTEHIQQYYNHKGIKSNPIKNEHKVVPFGIKSSQETECERVVLSENDEFNISSIDTAKSKASDEEDLFMKNSIEIDNYGENDLIITRVNVNTTLCRMICNKLAFCPGSKKLLSIRILNASILINKITLYILFNTLYFREKYINMIFNKSRDYNFFSQILILFLSYCTTYFFHGVMVAFGNFHIFKEKNYKKKGFKSNFLGYLKCFKIRALFLYLITFGIIMLTGYLLIVFVSIYNKISFKLLINLLVSYIGEFMIPIFLCIIIYILNSCSKKYDNRRGFDLAFILWNL